uniref:Uncharacterized protein n=1 Tax=Branchiostoma floridae TaxID=7739 RepID=C3YSK1_BRAFL|eukprot:XP_002600690.1 hypothetical protein BRAFLDRAFT_118553 [Branchiostoma floridae]
MDVDALQIAKSVEKRLEYYMNVKRLEEGFDPTGQGVYRTSHRMAPYDLGHLLVSTKKPRRFRGKITQKLNPQESANAKSTGDSPSGTAGTNGRVVKETYIPQVARSDSGFESRSETPHIPRLDINGKKSQLTTKGASSEYPRLTSSARHRVPVMEADRLAKHATRLIETLPLDQLTAMHSSRFHPIPQPVQPQRPRQKDVSPRASSLSRNVHALLHGTATREYISRTEIKRVKSARAYRAKSAKPSPKQPTKPAEEKPRSKSALGLHRPKTRPRKTVTLRKEDYETDDDDESDTWTSQYLKDDDSTEQMEKWTDEYDAEKKVYDEEVQSTHSEDEGDVNQSENTADDHHDNQEDAAEVEEPVEEEKKEKEKSGNNDGEEEKDAVTMDTAEGADKTVAAEQETKEEKSNDEKENQAGGTENMTEEKLEEGGAIDQRESNDKEDKSAENPDYATEAQEGKVDSSTEDSSIDDKKRTLKEEEESKDDQSEKKPKQRRSLKKKASKESVPKEVEDCNVDDKLSKDKEDSQDDGSEKKSKHKKSLKKKASKESITKEILKEKDQDDASQKKPKHRRSMTKKASKESVTVEVTDSSEQQDAADKSKSIEDSTDGPSQTEPSNEECKTDNVQSGSTSSLGKLSNSSLNVPKPSSGEDGERSCRKDDKDGDSYSISSATYHMHPSEDCPPDLKYDNSYVEHKTCENMVLQTFRKAVFDAQLVDTIVKKCGTDLRKCFDENADVRAKLRAHLKNTRDLYGQYCAKKSCVDFLLKYQKQCSPVAEDLKTIVDQTCERLVQSFKMSLSFRQAEDMKTIVDEKLLEFTTIVDLSCSDHSDASGRPCGDLYLQYSGQSYMKTIVDEKLLEFTTIVDLSCSDHSDASGRPCGDLYLQYRLALAASQAKNPETWADFRARINSSVQSGCPMNFPQGWSLRKDMLGCCANQTINTLIKYQGLWYKQVVQDTLQKCNTSVPADCSTSQKKVKSVYPSGVRFNTVVGIIAASVICVVGMFVFVRAVYTKIRKGEYEREDVRYSEILITDDDDEMGDGEDEEEEVDE